MYMPLSDDTHRKVRDSSKKRTGNPRQNSVQEFFPNCWKKFFVQTEFCLGLNLSQTEFCFGLNLSRITYRSCILYAIF